MTVWSLYLLQNQAGMLYAGISTAPERRLRQHNGEVKGGAKALRGKGPFQLRYQFQCQDKSQALSLEYQLKQLPRQKKCQWFEALLQANLPMLAKDQPAQPADCVLEPTA